MIDNLGDYVALSATLRDEPIAMPPELAVATPRGAVSIRNIEAA
ncbi:hypothetical protein OG225_05150 [Nocardia sp. NBC_01377]